MLRAARLLKIEVNQVELEPRFACIPSIVAAEQYLAGALKNFEGYFRIKRNEFPPDSRLTEEQVITLASEMLALLMTHRYDADLPKGITPRDAYNALLRRWNGAAVPYVAAAGHVHLEFWEDRELAKYYPDSDNADDFDGYDGDEGDGDGAPTPKKRKSAKATAAKSAKAKSAKTAKPRKRSAKATDAGAGDEGGEDVAKGSK
jgi:hypothetical protein